MADDSIKKYLLTGSPEESNWRSVILFGRNTASYKFALAQTLFELAQQGKPSATLEEIAGPFSAHICEHIKHSPKQGTSRTNSFLDACQSYTQGATSHDELIDAAKKNAFNYVFDAFHVVSQNNVPITFFEKDFTSAGKRIVLTDDLFRLATGDASTNIMHETESRWNLVETAWETGISAGLLCVSYSDTGQMIITESSNRRKDITSARGALDGYQKGHCFYCYKHINIGKHTDKGDQRSSGQKDLFTSNEPERYEYGVAPFGSEHKASNDASSTEPLCDVDHFYPHMLGQYVSEINWDGIWNLVLACPECNRGHGGKFERLADMQYLERLRRRNEYLIGSHHPLRETLIAQTGASTSERLHFLKTVDKIASDYLPGARWSTEQVAAPAF